MPPNYSICTKLLHRWTGKAIHLLQKANSEERFCKKVTDVIIVITSFLEFPDLSKTCWAIPNSVTHINKKIYDICTFTSIFSVTSRRYLIRSVRYLCSLLFIAKRFTTVHIGAPIHGINILEEFLLQAADAEECRSHNRANKNINSNDNYYRRRGASCVLKRSPRAPRMSIWNKKKTISVQQSIEPQNVDHT